MSKEQIDADLRRALMTAQYVRFMFDLDGTHYSVVRSSIRGRTCSIAVSFMGEGKARRMIVETFFWGLPDQATIEADLRLAKRRN